MNLKLLFIISFICLSNVNYAQKNQKDFYEVSFFKWVKNGDQDEKILFKVDSTGNVVIGDKFTGQKLNFKSFNIAIHKFVNLEKLEKIPGNAEPPRMALIPKNDQQSIYINIVFLKDYYNEKDLFNKTAYSWKKTGLDKEEDQYRLYKYLDKVDKEIMRALKKSSFLKIIKKRD
jgi:hypothetical protein